IDLRENKGIPIKLILQVDTLCHRIPGFIEKSARAGCNQVFVGLESVNPESLQGAKKRQNKIWEYRVMLQAWRKQKVMTWAGLITGFPTDTPESIARDIDIIKKELPLDILEFFFLTPLPGSEDHKVLYHKGVPMDPDMNKYDLEHVTTGHPRMSPDQWQKAYRDAYTRYYSDDHVETILKRAAATGLRMNKVADVMTAFSSAARIEGVHPLQCGIVRRKVRTSRRHGMPIVNPLIFYPVRAVEFVSVVAQWLTVGWRYHRIKKRVIEDPASKTYVDDATRPTTVEEAENDELVAAFADKIPDTYGAPKRQPVAAS
ncbi:MAG: radical SAM protein, partial [Roseiarcus sp.]